MENVDIDVSICDFYAVQDLSKVDMLNSGNGILVGIRSDKECAPRVSQDVVDIVCRENIGMTAGLAEQRDPYVWRCVEGRMVKLGSE